MLVISDDTMKLGVNNNVNRESHEASLKLMAGGPSKVKPPNSHPANPIHKKATEAQGLAEKKPTPKQVSTAPAISTTIQTPVTDDTSQELKTKTESVDSHHVNKTLVVVGALALVGLIYAFLEKPFHKEGYNSKYEQPSVLTEKGENLFSRFENEAYDCANETG